MAPGDCSRASITLWWCSVLSCQWRRVSDIALLVWPPPPISQKMEDPGPVAEKCTPAQVKPYECTVWCDIDQHRHYFGNYGIWQVVNNLDAQIQLYNACKLTMPLANSDENLDLALQIKFVRSGTDQIQRYPGICAHALTSGWAVIQYT